MINFYIKNRKILNIVLVIVFSIGFLGIANVAWAGPIDKAVTFVVGWIAIAIVGLAGIIYGMVIQSIINIAQYNNFINEESIVDAWIIVRDLCNMFFVLVLLVIAFATILRIENYNVKKLLPKLLIMAVLINFSRIICGVLIDFSQVIMLTFVSAFADGGGNLTNMLKVDEFLRVAKNSAKWIDPEGQDLDLTNTVTAILLAVVLMVVTVITMLAVLVVFLMRVIMLWIYVILSPLAFLLSAFPAGQKYASQFWGEFTRYLVNGPVLAFFIWLALITANKMDPGKISFLDKDSATITAIMGGDSFMPYLISIGLLVGGLMVSSQIGGMGANWGASTVKGLGSKVSGLTKKVVLGGALLGTKTGAKWTGRQMDTGQMAVQGLLAKGVSRITGERFGKNYNAKSLNYKIIQDDWKKSRDEKMRDYEGGKVGAWQDTFNSFTAASVGIPILSKVMEKNAEKEIDKQKEEKTKKETRVKDLEEEKQTLDPYKEKDEERRTNIETEIKNEMKEIEGEGGINDKIKKLKEVDWRVGKKMPKQKYFRLEQQRRVNEENSNISKEDLDESGLVDGYENETRRDKKRAYFQQLTDINGINTLMEIKGLEMNSSNIRLMLEKDFKNEAGDVAADMSKRAEIKGNMALVGHAVYDIKSGKSVLLERSEKGDNQQIEQAMKKDKEKYGQNYARTNHFDGLVDRNTNGQPAGLSKLGEKQLLAIAKNTGRFAEIKKGNFQIRYGNTVVDMSDNINQKIKEYREPDPKTGKVDLQAMEKADDLEKVLNEFKKSYGPTKGVVESSDEDLKEQMYKLKKELGKTSSGIKRSQVSNKIKDLDEKMKLQEKGQKKETELTDDNDNDNDND